jgi:quercetin dioxygenase-like cupin family protein
VRLHIDHLRDPIGHFDLARAEGELRSEAALATEGHSAVTLVKYPDLRVVLISMRAGARLGETQAEARLSVHTLRGRAALHLPEGTIDLPAGHLATLERGMRHDVEAREDSAVLLTLVWPGATRS